MTKKHFVAFLFTLPLTGPALADVYFHIGGGLDYLTHDKSENNYPALNLKGGIGYKVNPSVSIEFDATGKSGSKYSGTGTCTTTIDTQVSCTKNQEVSRLLAIGSGVYNRELGFGTAFIKIGVGFVKSTYRFAYDSTEAPSLVVTDADDSGFVGIVHAGLVKSDRHRFGGIISTKYGDSNVGKFQFFGFEYNYLITL